MERLLRHQFLARRLQSLSILVSVECLGSAAGGTGCDGKRKPGRRRVHVRRKAGFPSEPCERDTADVDGSKWLEF